MKEIIVCSDTHGRSAYLEELERAYPRADLFVHCGDLEDNAGNYPHWLFVRGNNDWDTAVPAQRIVRIGGVGILICHSHQFGYGNREEKMATAAINNNCQLVLFGHTHVPLVRKVFGVLLVNPGSMSLPRDGKGPCYAKIIIDDLGEIKVSLLRAPQWPFKPIKGWF